MMSSRRSLLPSHFIPQIPVISNTTMAAYPSDPGEIRRILMAHLESPVHWMNNVQTLWNDHGIRLFMEVGPGDILSDLIADTLPESACIQTCIPPAESTIYTTALAQLFVQGHLKVHGEPRWVSLPASGKPPEFHHRSGTHVTTVGIRAARSRPRNHGKGLACHP